MQKPSTPPCKHVFCMKAESIIDYVYDSDLHNCSLFQESGGSDREIKSKRAKLVDSDDDDEDGAGGGGGDHDTDSSD